VPFALLGLFLVPRGELEGWVPELAKKVEVRSKPERALIVANLVRMEKDKSDDVWEFMSKVLAFLFQVR
jgi:hypothetical protein